MKKSNPLSKANVLSCDELFSMTVRRLDKIHYLFGNSSFIFRYLKGPQVTNDEAEAVADIMEATVKRYLDGSSTGWSREQKITELKDPTSRVILIYPDTEPSQPTQSSPAAECSDGAYYKDDAPLQRSARDIAAFLCMRFELEDLEDPESLPVLYCYEIHISEPFRRCGLGRFLVEEMARLAKARHMDRVMLTVVKSNIQALAFYDAMGFSIDETSPDDADYHILSLVPRKS